MDPLSLGLSIGGSIFGSSRAKKEARRQMEMMKRQADATFNNTSRNLQAQYGMGLEDMIFGSAQQLLQERLNNQVALENWEWAQKREDQRLADINAGIAKNNAKKAALAQIQREKMVAQHAASTAQAQHNKSKTLRDIRKQSSMAAAKAGSSAAARGIMPGATPSILANMTAQEAAEKITDVQRESDLARRTASQQLHLDIAANYIQAQGDSMKRKVEGRPPKLFDSTRMIQYLMGRQAANMGKQFNLGMTNARAAKNAMIANAQNQYQSARSAANMQMWTGIGTTLAGYAMANAKFGPSGGGDTLMADYDDAYTKGLVGSDGWASYGNAAGGTTYISPYGQGGYSTQF